MPFHRPHSAAATNAARITTGSGVAVTFSTSLSLAINVFPRAGLISTVATAAEMATTAPTERSTPAVAITMVMPIASTISGAPRLMMSISEPNK